MMFTKCGHRFCDKCKNDFFNAKQSTVIFCPVCGESLKRADISEKSLQDKEFEEEIRQRCWLKHQFNEPRENFDTEKDYNDYLEFYEMIVELKLANGRENNYGSTKQKGIEREEL